MRTARTVFFAMILAALLAGRPAAVWAFPPLPSSFYGGVQLNGADLPDGARVEAVIDGQVFAYSLTQTYAGASVFSLDIPGDDLSTADVEGGREGDVISFRVAGSLAAQTGIWRSGTNASLDLTAASASAPLPLQPTAAPPPTQTPIPRLPTGVPPAPATAAVDPIPATDAPTPIAGVTTERPVEAAIAGAAAPSAARVESPTPPAATDLSPVATDAPTSATASPTLAGPPTSTPTDETAVRPSSDAQPTEAIAFVAPPVLGAGDKPVAAGLPSAAARKGGPAWLLWAGASLLVVAGLGSGAGWLLRRRAI